MSKQNNEQAKVYMSPQQIKETEAEIASLERMFKADRASGSPKIGDEREFLREIQKKKKLISDHAPEKVSGPQANKLYARAKELESKISEYLQPSRQFYMQKPKEGNSHDFDRAVQHEVKFQTDKRVKAEIMEYRSIMRRLDPSDPTVSNIERLRR